MFHLTFHSKLRILCILTLGPIIRITGLRFKNLFSARVENIGAKKNYFKYSKSQRKFIKFGLNKFFWQSAILLSLHLQLYGIISILKWNIRVLSYLSCKRNIVLKKTKYIKARKLCRKKYLCGFVLQKELTLGGERCSAQMLQITTAARALRWTRKTIHASFPKRCLKFVRLSMKFWAQDIYICQDI